MSTDHSAPIQRIKLLKTAPHSCSYLSGKRASTGFVDPELAIDVDLYARLSENGFRRSGSYIYTPMCGDCSACVSARIPVDLFTQSRSQRRCLKANNDISVTRLKTIDITEHYVVYADYINQRHADGDMYPPAVEQFVDFLGTAWHCTQFLEFRLDNRLIGCAIVDVLPDAVSAIYTYFDPIETRRGLGNFAVLYQIAMAKELALSHVYLGYWIEDCKKMSYKLQYKPIELLQGNTWKLSK
jgi:arginine-tRNA-protein transferase